MKVLNKNGLLSDDGIMIRCPYCKSEFLIENKHDIDSEVIYEVGDIVYNDSYICSAPYALAYSVVTPCCSRKIDLGVNPYESRLGKFIDAEFLLGVNNIRVTSNCTTEYSIIFERGDWANRFSHINN